ncbi:hypothetical protein ACFL13_02385 [Patescibacteria group bacterium]
MSVLLLKLFGNRSFNRMIFRPKLFIYSDKLVYKKRHLLSHEEFSITYNHVVQVNLRKLILFFAHIDIVNSSGDHVMVTFVPKKDAIKAKDIIDGKIYQAHVKEKSKHTGHTKKVVDFEKSLKRLRELVQRGRISEREYKKKRNQLLKKH